jgi:hypothetical protein
MEKIRNKDIIVTRHVVDGFMLSYITESGDYYHKRYIGYSIRDAKARLWQNGERAIVDIV